MKLVGLTGGIGSGKTFCARIFEWLGVPVYNADEAAKRLMHQNDKLKKQIIDLFGPQSYGDNHEVNRVHLATLVFNDPSKLKALNQIVHPAVRQDFISWGGRHLLSPYVIQESAILMETGSYRFFDKNIVVYAPENMRLQRVIKRDDTTEEVVRARMANQWKGEKTTHLADYVIVNDGSKPVIPQVLRIHYDLLRLSQMEEE